MKTDAESSLWLAVTAVAVWDCIFLVEICSFIRQSEFWGFYAMVVMTVLALPAVYFAVRTYLSFREIMPPSVRLVVRLPLCCMAGLLATYFIAFPVLERFTK